MDCNWVILDLWKMRIFMLNLEKIFPGHFLLWNYKDVFENNLLISEYLMERALTTERFLFFI